MKKLFAFVNVKTGIVGCVKTKEQSQMCLDTTQWTGWTLCELVPVKLSDETVTTTRKVIP